MDGTWEAEARGTDSGTGTGTKVSDAGNKMEQLICDVEKMK